MGVTCRRCLLDLCEPPFLLFCVPVCGYACETAFPDSLWDSASQQWSMAVRGRCPLWGARVRAAVQRALSEPAPRTVALGAGLQYHLPPPSFCWGPFPVLGTCAPMRARPVTWV